MMLSFEEGYRLILALALPLDTEKIELRHGLGRVLREDIKATRPQPATDISAMDGYALSGEHSRYQIIGEIAAGARELPTLNQGQALRIFTGAPIPLGSDRVMIQENAIREEDWLTGAIPAKGENIRKKGSDFNENYQLSAPSLLTPETISLIAALNQREIIVSRRPRVAILPTGSELVEPTLAKSAFDVISSNPYGLATLIECFGGLAEILPICPDQPDQITSALEKTYEYDLVVTTGGASVGDYDHVPRAARAAGFEIVLHKIAIRPGKPVLAGKRDKTIFLGLPGNPVSAMVTGRIFLQGLIRLMLGLKHGLPAFETGYLSHDLPKNGERWHFMRALIWEEDGKRMVKVFENQDSAVLSILAKSNGFAIRESNEPATSRGGKIKFIRLMPIEC